MTGAADETTDSAAPTTLVLLRHGRTTWNAERRMQGQRDVELDEVGRAQALAAAAALAPLQPALVWASDLQRAHVTARRVGEASGLPVVADPRLRELFFGESEGLTHEELRARSPEGYAALRRADYHLVPGAEPVEEVRERMRAVLHDLLAVLAPGSTGIAVSHGAAIRVAVGAVLGWDDDAFRTLGPLDNCGWVVLRTAHDGARVRLAAYNRTAGAGPHETPEAGSDAPR